MKKIVTRNDDGTFTILCPVCNTVAFSSDGPPDQTCTHLAVAYNDAGILPEAFWKTNSVTNPVIQEMQEKIQAMEEDENSDLDDIPSDRDILTKVKETLGNYEEVVFQDQATCCGGGHYLASDTFLFTK